MVFAPACGRWAQKPPQHALVVGWPLTVNNDRHQDAKCPVQDVVGISLLTGGKWHLLGCLMQRWFISLCNSPHLKAAVSLFRWERAASALCWSAMHDPEIHSANISSVLKTIISLSGSKRWKKEMKLTQEFERIKRIHAKSPPNKHV